MYSDIRFQSMASRLRQVVDCRLLFFEVEFHQVGREALTKASLEYCKTIQAFENECFISSWEVNDRRIAGNKMEESIVNFKKSLQISSEANVRSDIIKLKSELHRYLRKQELDTSLPFPHHYSADFPDYYSSHFSLCLDDKEAFCEGLLRLFNETRKHKLGYYRGPDACGMLYSMPYIKDQNHFRGRIHYAIAIECISEGVSLVADSFVVAIKKLCNILKSANGRVGIAPYPIDFENISPYMKYFGMTEVDWEEVGDHSHLEFNCHPKEWYPFYYLCGLEWANVISNLTLSHLPSKTIKAIEGSPLFVFVQQPCGNVFIQFKMDVLDLEACDLAILKQLLYPALFPGRAEFPLLKTQQLVMPWVFPRSSWEIVSIFPEELEIVNSKILFQHKSQKHSPKI
jgi:hypothetical protein